MSNPNGDQMVDELKSLKSELTKLKKKIQEERDSYVKEKIKINRMRVKNERCRLLSTPAHRREASSPQDGGPGQMLTARMENPIYIISREGLESYEDEDNDQNVTLIATAKFPEVEKIPNFTTWTFVNRNYKMTEDQSMIGKQHIYYDQIGGEAIHCTDEEKAEEGDEKHDFSEGEKFILRRVCQEYEPTEELLQMLTEFIGGTTSEIHEAFNMVKKEEEEKLKRNASVPVEVEDGMNMFLEKSLVTCLDSFDALFCRRCLAFDCKPHGYSQPVITPSERPKYPHKEDGRPCGDQCYLQSPVPTYPERGEGSSSIYQWRPFEKDLYVKGIEIFGRNSCLIARNLFTRLKTCTEVYSYMHVHDGGSDVLPVSSPEEQGMASTSKLVRRKGKAKKVKHSSKSGGHSSPRKRIGGLKDSLEKQYTPCECKSMCGKQCPCLKNSTCCEKYCGCSRSCKNRFRGCHCAKGQCRSQQCPCFAADRECDPDVCRNCWISCGDESLRGEEEEGQCRNMRLLLMQHEKILLGKSDVAGWGAFAQNSHKKGDYLGEYTGELISHEEADWRGKLYDRANSSYLFNLNQEYVIDASRKGNKLKFANHSHKPNCYAKIMKTAGDHRVAIFANKSIEAGDELFYDYGYGPERSPIWAKKPDPPPSKPGPSAPHGRSKKNARR